MRAAEEAVCRSLVAVAPVAPAAVWLLALLLQVHQAAAARSVYPVGAALLAALVMFCWSLAQQKVVPVVLW